MLERGNVDCFDWAIRHLPSDAPIVEIGSFCGLSTNVMTYLKRHHGKTNRLITCDRWIFERRDKTAELDDSGVSFDDYREFVRETFLRNAHMFSRHDLPFTVELFSDEFFEAWTARDTMNDVFGRSIALGGEISFCYIDGSHLYDVAKRDFANADRFLQRGGFILLDDSGDSTHHESRLVAQEVLSDARYKLVTRNPNYLFQKV
jgi:hypothetical protein